MAKQHTIPDAVYREELERMSGLAKFPEMPAAQTELIRVMRRITETDAKFLHNLISCFVDSNDVCPMPSNLYARAGEMRAIEHRPMGRASCPHCDGAGWIHTTRMVKLPGLQAYEAESAKRCTCVQGA